MTPPFQGLISLPDRGGLGAHTCQRQSLAAQMPEVDADVQVLDALTAGRDVWSMLDRLELTEPSDRPVAQIWKLLSTMLQDAKLQTAYASQTLPTLPLQRRWMMSHAALVQGILCRHSRLRRMVLALRWLEDASELPQWTMAPRRGAAAESYQKMFSQLRGGSVLGAVTTAREAHDAATACMLFSAVMSAPEEDWMRGAQMVPLFGEYRDDVGAQLPSSRNEHRLSALANLAEELRELGLQAGDADAAAGSLAAGAGGLFERGIMGMLCGDYNAMVAACRALREGVLTWQDDLWCRLRAALVAGLSLAIHGGGFRAAGESWTDASHSAFLHAVKARCLPTSAADPQWSDGDWEQEMETHLANSVCEFLRMQKLQSGTADAVQAKLLQFFLETRSSDVNGILTAAVPSSAATGNILAPRVVCALHVALHYAHRSNLLPHVASPQGSSFNDAIGGFLAAASRKAPHNVSIENLASLISWVDSGAERSRLYASLLVALRRQACTEEVEVAAVASFQAAEDVTRRTVQQDTVVVDNALRVAATEFGDQLVLRTPHRKADELWLLSLTAGATRRPRVRVEAAGAMDALWQQGAVAAESSSSGHHVRIGMRVNRNLPAIAAVVRIWQERIALWDGDASQARAATFWSYVCDAHTSTEAVITSSTALSAGGALPAHEAALRLSVEEAVDRVAGAVSRAVALVSADHYIRVQAAAYALELLGRCLLAAKLGADPAARLKQLMGLNAALARTGAFDGPLSAADAEHLNATVSAVRAGFAIEQKNRIREERRQKFHSLV